MGKPFETELAKLGETHSWAQDLDIAPLAAAFERITEIPVIIVAAGGSYTAAEFARLLFESRGAIAVSHTPQSFLQCASNLRRTTVLLYTAGGNNRDITACFQAAVWREAHEIIIVCGNPNSKIDILSNRVSNAVRFFEAIPSGKDGYLATNSLYGFCALTMRAFGYKLPPIDEIWDKNAIRPITARPYFLGVYGDWGRPAAVDLESKFGEAGLGGVTVCDFRNFAHGRHNWIDKKGGETTVICFDTPQSSKLAERTLDLLPKDQSVYRIKTENEGPIGGLSLLLNTFDLTLAMGQIVGIDPGRPGIPQYGSKIYRLGPLNLLSRPQNKSDSLIKVAVTRKLSATNYPISSPFQITLESECSTFIEFLEKGRFGAIIADFDGTVAPPGIAESALEAEVAEPLIQLLANGIPVYFATGRGDSIHAILKNTFPEDLWDQIFISYYNGAFTLSLDQSVNYPDECLDNQFTSLDRALSKVESINSLGSISNKNHQLSIKVNKSVNPTCVAKVVTEFIEREFPNYYRIVSSSHSIDVIPMERSKCACISLAESALKTDKSVLTIGDRGAFPGNDYALLSHRFSLSVDQVSSDSRSCWNLLPPGIRGPAGFAHYSKWFKIKAGEFRIKIP